MLIPNCPFPHKCRQILPKRKFDDPNYVSKKSFKTVSFNIDIPDDVDVDVDSNCSNHFRTSFLSIILLLFCLILLK